MAVAEELMRNDSEEKEREQKEFQALQVRHTNVEFDLILSWRIGLVWFMMFNTTFNNISVIPLWSVLLVEETGENHSLVANRWQTLSHNTVSSTAHHEQGSNSQL